mgnify:CR=1 FL=1
MRKIVIGQILRDGKVMGTGFLVEPDIVMTVKHNVVTADELLTDEFEEKEIVFRIEDNDKVVGKTINLLEAIEKGIDCVFIRLNEVLSEAEMYELIDVKNEIVGVGCHIIGFPKLISKKTTMLATITNTQEEKLIVNIKKENQLQNYEGVSGAPVIVLGNVVGVITKQENSEQLEALPIKYINKVLKCEKVSIKKKEISVSISEKSFSLKSLTEKVEQVISMVGPRYSKELNVKTGTYSNLSFMLKKDGIAERLQNISSQIKDCTKKLLAFDSYNRDEENLVLTDSRKRIIAIAKQLQTDSIVLDSDSCDESELTQILKNLKECEQDLTKIFEVEKKRFEEKNGVGTYDNKSWRGFMASYMCIFPTQYLDELKDVISTLPLIARLFDISLINNAGSRAILITGKGGIGKTHLLCDIVHDFVDKGIPAVLLLGDMFKGKDTADNVIINWFQKGETIENFFAWLNEYGNQNNVYVPICIDAINEVDDTSYWNSNLPLIIAKAKAYSNIKIIVSCRSIYLEEYLDEEKIREMLQVPHSGFNEMEVEALGSFCKYYGVNINYDTTYIPEFMNPLFLKMLCEIAIEKEDKTVVVEDIQTLMEEFFDVKNKIISKNYSEYFSVKDKVVSLALKAVTQFMSDNDRYSMNWFELRTVIAKVLDEFGIKEKTAGFIKLLISENLLREADEKGTEIAFAYQKFYEYLYAQKYANIEAEIIVEAVEDKKITLGTLEMIQILFMRNTKEEFISRIDDKIHGEVVETFMSGLYWRNVHEINEKTIAELEKLLSSSNESDIRRVILGLIAVSTKNGCAINAYYIHKKLSNMASYRRDLILSLFLLKQYDQVKIISDTCERAIALKHPTFAEDSILLWKIILCWGTGSNDIKLRDKASKGLVNLFRLYPLDMLTVINMFKDIDDDYIHERIWQAVYSSLVILAEQAYIMPILEYIKNSIISGGVWPQNVLIRDYLRNIFEYAYYKEWCTEKEVILVRPPYKSKMHKVNNEFSLQFKKNFPRLFWNCQESDFAIYTIPSEVQNYGVTKKDVGLMIFEDIVKSGYEPCINYDKSIDYTYGSLRNRDEQVERISKKYQKIYLYRELGNIYDNYKYSPKFRYSDIELVCPEQGNSLRNIDLMAIPQFNNFTGTKLVYPFYRYCKWNDTTWFKNNDVERYIPKLIQCIYEGEEYYMLQGYLSSKEVGKKAFREVWMQVRTYLYSKDKKNDLLKWFDKKDFEGRWMPEGFGQLYECCIGEYPWSPTMVNYLRQEEEQDFRQETPAPCYLITTANDYTAEKDSPFCTNEESSYMFPSKYLMDQMNLTWNSSFGYTINGRLAIVNGQNNALYIKKSFLLEFIKRKELDIVWTVLGEKQKITGGFGRDFPGRAEFSYTYYLNEKDEVSRNHEVYNIMEAGRY